MNQHEEKLSEMILMNWSKENF